MTTDGLTHAKKLIKNLTVIILSQSTNLISQPVQLMN